MNWTERFINYIGITDRLTIIKIKYGIEIVRTEISKMVIMFFFFLVIGKAPEYLFSLLVLAPLRSFSGGMHLKTKIGCFIFSFIVMLSAIYLLPLLAINVKMYYFILPIPAIVIFWLSPVFTKKRPVKTKERYLYLRKRSIISLVISLTLVVGASLLGYTSLFITGTWIITIQAIQLIIGKTINWRGGITNGSIA